MRTYKTPFGERVFTEEDYRVQEEQLRTLVTSSDHPDYDLFTDDGIDGDAPEDLRDYGYYVEDETRISA